MNYNGIKKENAFGMVLVNKMTDTVEYVHAYSECYIAQIAAINKLIAHRDDKDKLYRTYVLDNDMYCKYSYCLYDNEIMSLPGGFLDEMLSEKIVQFAYDELFHELCSKLFGG